MYTDDYLQNHMIPVLRSSNIVMGIESWGALWAECTFKSGPYRGKTLGEVNRHNDIKLIKHIQSLGGEIKYISLISVLSKRPDAGRFDNCKLYEGAFSEDSIKQRIQDIAAYIKNMHRIFPEINIGEFDSLVFKDPRWRTGDAYGIAKKVFDRVGIYLNFWGLDLPYEVPEYTLNGLAYDDIKVVQDKIRSTGTLFGIITASMASRTIGANIDSYPHAQGPDGARLSHINTLKYMFKLRSNGISPDIYYSNCYFPQPQTALPDNDVNIFSQFRTIRGMGNFLKESSKK